MNKEEEKICELIKKHLEGFSLFNGEHTISARLNDDGASAHYYATKAKDPFKRHFSTHFTIQFIGPICYFLDAKVVEKERGKSQGTKLYEIVEDIAREYGSERIRGTASGVTVTGETRKDWMLRRGYKEVESDVTDLAVEKLLQ